MRFMSPRREKRGGGDVFVVTSAGRSRRQEIDDRQRKYIIKMAIRTVCLIAAIVLYSLDVPFIFVLALIIASTVMPWMSVVVANAGPTPEPQGRRPEAYNPDPVRALRPGRRDTPDQP